MEISEIEREIKRRNWTGVKKLIRRAIRKKRYSLLVEEVTDLLDRLVFNELAWIDHPSQTRRHPLLPMYTQLLNLLIRCGKADHITYSQRAALRYELDDYEGAVKDYEKYIAGLRQRFNKSDEDSRMELTAVLNHQAKCCIITGQFKKALKNLKEAQQIEPDNEYLWVTEGQLYEEKGDVDRAVSAYQHAVSLSPNSLAEYAKRRLAELHRNQATR